MGYYTVPPDAMESSAPDAALGGAGLGRGTSAAAGKNKTEGGGEEACRQATRWNQDNNSEQKKPSA